MTKPSKSKTMTIAALGARALNPYVPACRAKTVPDRKAVASKRACRGRVKLDQ